MKVTALSDPKAVARRAADVLAEVVAENRAATLGLPTGNTVVPLYAELRRRHEAGELDLSKVRALNVDELALPPEHPASFARYMAEHAWEHIGLDRERCDIPVGDGDLEAECRRYDALLAEAGPFDLLLLGIGVDGHLAYNLPGPPEGGTHVVELGDALARSLGVAQEERPLRAITIGFDPMHAARRVVILATGHRKADAVRALLHGPKSQDWPATLLRDHPRLELVLDRQLAEASGALA